MLSQWHLIVARRNRPVAVLCWCCSTCFCCNIYFLLASVSHVSQPLGLRASPAFLRFRQVEEGSPLEGKWIGFHKTEPFLDLRKNQHIQVLFIEPADRSMVVTCPGPNNKLEINDWVYITYDPNLVLARELDALGLATSHETLMGTSPDAEPTGIEFYPEFDEFRSQIPRLVSVRGRTNPRCFQWYRRSLHCMYLEP